MRGALDTLGSKTRLGMTVAAVVLCLGWRSPLAAQYNPALREDAEIERQKILRSADQLDLLVAKVEQLQAETTALRQKVEALEVENQKLAVQLDASEKLRAKEKQTLLEEVAKLVAKGGTSAPAGSPAAPPVSTGGAPVKNLEGYEHKVQHGETLWSIMLAYREATGTKATLEDICAASNISKSQPLRSGQILFIPKK